MGNTCVPKHSTHSRTCRKPAEDQVDPAFAVSGDPSRDLVRRADQMRADPSADVECPANGAFSMLPK